jgi:hypothetical protein
MEYFCEECGEHFEDAFEYIDHYFDGKEEFDPKLVLPNGFKFMVGSLLRFIYYNSDDPEQIRQITQSSYVTLFAAEVEHTHLEDLIEDMVVQSEMMRFDLSLKELLEEKKRDDNENGI